MDEEVEWAVPVRSQRVQKVIPSPKIAKASFVRSQQVRDLIPAF
jgi:hypothetical protein